MAAQNRYGLMVPYSPHPQFVQPIQAGPEHLLGVTFEQVNLFRVLTGAGEMPQITPIFKQPSSLSIPAENLIWAKEIELGGGAATSEDRMHALQTVTLSNVESMLKAGRGGDSPDDLYRDASTMFAAYKQSYPDKNGFTTGFLALGHVAAHNATGSLLVHNALNLYGKEIKASILIRECDIPSQTLREVAIHRAMTRVMTDNIVKRLDRRSLSGDLFTQLLILMLTSMTAGKTTDRALDLVKNHVALLCGMFESLNNGFKGTEMSSYFEEVLQSMLGMNNIVTSLEIGDIFKKVAALAKEQKPHSDPQIAAQQVIAANIVSSQTTVDALRVVAFSEDLHHCGANPEARAMLAKAQGFYTAGNPAVQQPQQQQSQSAFNEAVTHATNAVRSECAITLTSERTDRERDVSHARQLIESLTNQLSTKTAEAAHFKSERDRLTTEVGDLRTFVGSVADLQETINTGKRELATAASTETALSTEITRLHVCIAEETAKTVVFISEKRVNDAELVRLRDESQTNVNALTGTNAELHQLRLSDAAHRETIQRLTISRDRADATDEAIKTLSADFEAKLLGYTETNESQGITVRDLKVELETERGRLDASGRDVRACVNLLKAALCRPDHIEEVIRNGIETLPDHVGKCFRHAGGKHQAAAASGGDAHTTNEDSRSIRPKQ